MNIEKIKQLLTEALDLLSESVAPTPTNPSTPATGKHIVIDVGHSKSSEGATHRIDKIGENAWNWEVATLLKNELQALGFTGSIIDREPYGNSISAECREINKINPDLVISLHFNSGGGTGTEMLYCTGSTKGKRFAELLLKHTVLVLGLPNRGVKAKVSGEDGYAFLVKTNAPAVICEPFFGDKQSDCEQVAKVGKAALAKAYALAIRDYFA